jgi:DNA-binding NtrC family response regulator
MDGIELLSRIRSLYPCVTRIMLSAYSESETVIVAVNRGAIYNYSVKPCNPSDRSEGVRAGIRVYREQRSRSALPA